MSLSPKKKKIRLLILKLFFLKTVKKPMAVADELCLYFQRKTAWVFHIRVLMQYRPRGKRMVESKVSRSQAKTVCEDL